MSKFIDMDKLVLPKGTVNRIQERGVPAILDWLAEQESIEVVRCKDCKYRKTLPNWIHGQSIDTYYCKRFCDSDIGKVELNDFCSYGERKGDD